MKIKRLFEYLIEKITRDVVKEEVVIHSDKKW